MRIVAGTKRGRPIKTPARSDQSIRPTSDRVRESLFNILAHRFGSPYEGGRVLDLFAGTGALGLEALSRGASFALFVDNGATARGLIRENIQAMGWQGNAKLFRRDASGLGPIGTMKPFDIVFLDPPYGRGLGEKALTSLTEGQWLRDEAIVVLEEGATAGFCLPQNYVLEDERRTGDTITRILVCVSETPMETYP
ncbi:MAG: 16S rRNA (guanine(966)-N(2))-methyltransferase RsmD [Pseudomonadota bacterium]